MAEPRVRRRPTLAEVAQAAGVGKATASRALAATDHPDVGAETRERVRAVAAQLGYRPSSTARALRTGRFDTLSVVVPYDLWEWLEATLLAAGEEAERSGFQLLVHPMNTHSVGVAPLLERLADIPTDALVLIDPTTTPEQEERLRGLDIPVVFIDDVSEHPWAPTLAGANRDGGYQATRHLVESGRTRVAALALSGTKRFVQERLAGYRAALAEAGLPVREELVVTVPDICTPSKPFMSPETVARLREAEVDGVFAMADYLAASLVRELRREGVRVPEDMSVVGFDDERSAVLVDPQLTTIRQPTAEMGRQAVRLALSAVRGETVPAELHELPVELVVRDSSVPTRP